MAIANYAKTCSKNTPGGSTLMITEAANINVVTIATGEVTALTMLTGSTFKTIDIDMDSLAIDEEGLGNKAGNMSYTTKLLYKLSKLSTEVNAHRTEIADASICGIVALVKDGNGIWWLLGYNATDLTKRALRAMQSNAKTGLAPSDEDAGLVDFILQSSSGSPMLPVKETSTVSTSGIVATT